MFDQITKLFCNQKAIEEQEAVSLLKQKLARSKSSIARKAPVNAENNDTASGAALSYWTERASEGTAFSAPEPHILQSLSQSETVLQPGSAEKFQVCRMHPLDELSSRRERNATAFSVSRFLQKKGIKKASA